MAPIMKKNHKCYLSYYNPLKKICEGGNKSGLYAHMKMLIEKRKEKKDSKLELIDLP